MCVCVVLKGEGMVDIEEVCEFECGVVMRDGGDVSRGERLRTDA